MIQQKNRIEQARKNNWFDRMKQAIKEFNLTLHDVANQKIRFQHQVGKNQEHTDERNRLSIIFLTTQGLDATILDF